MAQDITERKRLEQDRTRLLEQERAARTAAEAQASQLDRIFETLTDGLIVYDPDGRLVRTNTAARRILGMDAAPPDVYARPLRERTLLYETRDAHGAAVAPEDWPAMRIVRGETLTGRDAMDVQVRTPDGREVFLDIRGGPLHDHAGRLVGAVCIFRDQTERKRLEREREVARADELATREVNRRMEEFLATAAHDLRAPLTTTLGFLALAGRRFQRLAATAQGESPTLLSQVEAVRGRLEEAGESGERLSRLVALLFDTAALRAGKLELHRMPCDLVALVREQVEAQRVAAPGRAIRLHAPAGGLVPVVADADRLAQVVANYLTNALKYSPPGRPVNVSMDMSKEAGEGWARVAVHDAGPGLPEGERARVWEPFHRAPGVAARGGACGSLGLGLHISKEIVEAHGGRVGVESTVGRGSTFWFILPLSSDPAPGLGGVVP